MVRTGEAGGHSILPLPLACASPPACCPHATCYPRPCRLEQQQSSHHPLIPWLNLHLHLVVGAIGGWGALRGPCTLPFPQSSQAFHLLHWPAPLVLPFRDSCPDWLLVKLLQAAKLWGSSLVPSGDVWFSLAFGLFDSVGLGGNGTSNRCPNTLLD